MKKILAALALATFIGLLSGCAATVTKSSGDAAPIAVTAEAAKHIAFSVTGSKTATDSKDWAAFKGMWNDAMKAEADAAGRRLTVVEGEAKPSGDAGTLVVVYVNDYRWVSAGARFAVGVMTGNAFIDSKASFSDLASGRALGERVYNTTSSAGQGIFAPMTDKQIAAICKEIVAEVKAR